MADPTPPVPPVIKRVNLTPIQQRIPAVSQDGTLSNAFHGEINRMISALSRTTNNNADVLQLVIDVLDRMGVLVGRVDDIEVAQQATLAEQALVNSYTSPTAVLSASTSAGGVSSVVVANHQRVYADAAKTTVSVTGKTFNDLLPSTYYFFYYDDPTRAGGAVDVKVSTNNLDAAQTGTRHSLGGIYTPAVNEPPESGGGTTPPGGGGYNPRPGQNQD